MVQAIEPDYEKLRSILERELGRKVSLEYAIEVGNKLINIYEVLLSDEATSGTIKEHTTNQ